VTVHEWINKKHGPHYDVFVIAGHAFGTALNKTHPLTTGVHASKNAYVLSTDNLKGYRKSMFLRYISW